jgi:capsular exopolysaccharide synthesis family protein
LYNSSRVTGNRYPSPVGTEPGPGTRVGAAEGEYVLSVAELLRVIRRRLWVVLLVAAGFTAAAVGFSLAQTPMYEASIKILVGQERGITETPNDVMGLQQLTQTMAEGVSSRPVAEAVIRQQGLRMSPDHFLEENLSVELVPNTQFIEVAYRDTDPERAQRVVNAVGEVFSERVSEVSPSANAVTATVWERAATPEYPVSPNPVRNGLLALMVGLVIGVGLAFLLEQLDDRWRSPEEVEQISGEPTFGVIPEFDVFKGKKESPEMAEARRRQGEVEPTSGLDELVGRLVTVLDPTSATSEAYRTLRTNLLYALVDNPPKVIVLTSPGPGEGKSTICANLGVVLAQAGKDTLIVDCDFRKPVIHRFFGLRNLHGVVNILVEERKLQEVSKEPVDGLKVVPVGPVPSNPTEILGTRRFSGLLASFREEFDYVLIDAPPVGLVSDPAILATQGDGVLLVLNAQNTRKGSVRQAMRSLEAVRANVLGTVMNNVEVSKSGYYYDSYTYR